MSEATHAGRHRWPVSAFLELAHRPANQLAALDGLRAMAVLLVICDHWVFEWVSIARLQAPSFVRFPLFYWGWTGVDLFFVLSGFLIGKQLWGELFRTGSIRVGRFVLRRGLRIWPLYYVSMVLLAWIPSQHAPQGPDWWMLSNYVPTRYARSWSLSTEEQFYLLMPTLLLVFRKIAPARWWPGCVLAVLALVPLSRAFTFAALSTQSLAPERISVLMYAPFHLHCEPLLIGLLVAWVSLRRPDWFVADNSSRAARRIIIGAGALAVAGIALRMINREVFAYLALGSVYGAALLMALADRSVVTAVLRWKVWYPIARLSFGMYLNHLILREPTDSIIAFVRASLGERNDIAFSVGLAFTVLASAMTAAMTFVLVEQPGLALRDRWLARSRATAETAQPVVVR